MLQRERKEREREREDNSYLDLLTLLPAHASLMLLLGSAPSLTPEGFVVNRLIFDEFLILQANAVAAALQLVEPGEGKQN